MERLEATLIGEVQGVNMRYHCKFTAEKLGVTGVVWNDPTDESKVHLVAEGPRGTLQTFLREVKNYEWGHVDKVEEKWSKATGEVKDFRIKV